VHLHTRTFLLLAATGLGACGDDLSLPTTEADHAAAHARTAAPTTDVNRQLAELRRVTAPFHDLDAAIRAGYAEQVTPCWESRSQGAMGYHYGKMDLFDGSVDLLEPEVLMFEPNAAGQMRLVGMEYIVPIDAWTSGDPPTLLGETFHAHAFLPIYKLHIWLWRENPRGLYKDWNPRVSCRHAEETEFFD
jgi:hypothetical protein